MCVFVCVWLSGWIPEITVRAKFWCNPGLSFYLSLSLSASLSLYLSLSLCLSLSLSLYLSLCLPLSVSLFLFLRDEADTSGRAFANCNNELCCESEAIENQILQNL